MSNESDHNLEQQEIHLHTSDGLALFTQHIEEQWQEFQTAAKIVAEEVSAVPEIKKGKEAYYLLQGFIAQANADLQNIGETDSDLLTAMQAAYDDFLLVYLSVTTKAEAALEQQEKTKKSIDDAYPARPLKEDSIVTKNLQNDPAIFDSIEKHYRTLAAFEAALWRTVRQIEEPSQLDKVLKVKHGSIFKEIFRGTSVAELNQLLELSGEQVRAALREMQIEDQQQYDYRTYVLWTDLYREMLELIEPAESVLFEELLALRELIIKEALSE